MNPIDLLPIKHPSLEQPEDTLFFYTNVVQPLISDILRIESNGIPINLDKVKELEVKVANILDDVNDTLQNNKVMLNFLEAVTNKQKKNKTKELQSKKKVLTDFYKPFSFSNKVHRTYVINLYLDRRNYDRYSMTEWSIKDLQKLNQIIASKFIQDYLAKDPSIEKHPITIDAMQQLAEDKCNAYNKNKIQTKIEALEKEKTAIPFNPGSSTQIREFFEFYGIESENETAKGNSKWDRDELLRVQKLLKTLIGE